MVPFKVVEETSEDDSQKNKALPLLKGIKEGMKLKLQELAMALAVPPRPTDDSTHSQMKACDQFGSGFVFWDNRIITWLGSDQGLLMRFWRCGETTLEGRILLWPISEPWLKTLGWGKRSLMNLHQTKDWWPWEIQCEGSTIGEKFHNANETTNGVAMDFGFQFRYPLVSPCWRGNRPSVDGIVEDCNQPGHGEGSE